MKKSGLIIRPYSLGEIAKMYEVSRPTMKKWLKPFLPKIGALRGRFYNCLQVEKIFRFFGVPGRRMVFSDR